MEEITILGRGETKRRESREVENPMGAEWSLG